jgi:hypothetical protein
MRARAGAERPRLRELRLDLRETLAAIDLQRDLSETELAQRSREAPRVVRRRARRWPPRRGRRPIIGIGTHDAASLRRSHDAYVVHSAEFPAGFCLLDQAKIIEHVRRD